MSSLKWIDQHFEGSDFFFLFSVRLISKKNCMMVMMLPTIFRKNHFQHEIRFASKLRNTEGSGAKIIQYKFSFNNFIKFWE